MPRHVTSNGGCEYVVGSVVEVIVMKSAIINKIKIMLNTDMYMCVLLTPANNNNLKPVVHPSSYNELHDNTTGDRD